MKGILVILFSILYASIGTVSVYHAIAFFSISNNNWLAVVLALAFEIGQAAVLFSLLVNKSKKTMPWILMGVLTLVQVLGNVYSSYQYAALNSPDEIKYFTDSVLFFVQDPDPQVNQIVDVSGVDQKKKIDNQEVKDSTNEVETIESKPEEEIEEKNQIIF